MLDTLKVAIEADYSSLKVTLQSAMNSFTGFMNEVNSGNVDWIKILQGTFTPALIATIASTFALALEQGMIFQQQMAQMGASLPSTLGGGVAATSDQINSMVQATGQSTSAVSAAFTAMYKQFGDTADAEQVTDVLGQMATLGVAPLSQLTSDASTIFQEFNITTGTDAVTALNNLYTGLVTSKLTYSDFVQTIITNGSSLHSVGENFSDLTTTISGLSHQSGITASDVDADIKLIATTAVGQGNPFSQLYGGVTNLDHAIGANGLQPVLETLQSTLVNKTNPSAKAFGEAIGLSNTQVEDMRESTPSAFSDVFNAQDKVLQEQLKINDAYTKFLSMNPTAGLMNKAGGDIGNSAVGFLGELMGGLSTLGDLLGLNGSKAQSNTGSLVGAGISSDLSGVLGSSGMLSSLVTNSGSIGVNGIGGEDIVGILTQILSALTGNNNNVVNNKSTVINNGTPGHVASTASTSQAPTAN